jgi:two-component system sensor histidine kinase UhpB
MDRQGQRAGFKTEFYADPPDLRLPSEMETVLFRVVQEALTNVVRHAVASHVQVMIIKHDDELELVIRDNGIGFNVHAVRERASGDLTLGLLGMQERVQLIGGKIHIASHPDHGTEIRAIFNLSSTQNSALPK